MILGNIISHPSSFLEIIVYALYFWGGLACLIGLVYWRIFHYKKPEKIFYLSDNEFLERDILGMPLPPRPIAKNETKEFRSPQNGVISQRDVNLD